MATVTFDRCTFKKSGSTIQLELSFKVSFTETETRLDVGFVPELVVTPSTASTQGIMAGTERQSNGPGAFAGMADEPVPLSYRRREVALTFPVIKPSGQRSVSATSSATINVADLFNRADAPAKWTGKVGLDIVRLSLNLDLAGARQEGIPTQPCTEDGAAGSAVAGPVIDTTDDLKGTITARGDNGSGESKEKAFDNQSGSKWLDFYSAQGTWIQYAYAASSAGRLTAYSITSANDSPERDPADFQLLGSNDGGKTFTTIDSRSGVSFSDRFQKQTFQLSGSPTFKAYRLNITKVQNPGAASCLQLADIELLGQLVAAP